MISEALTIQGEEELWNLTFSQVRDLTDKFRPEIAAEWRPGHRDELYGKTQEETG